MGVIWKKRDPWLVCAAQDDQGNVVSILCSQVIRQNSTGSLAQAFIE